MPVVFLIVVLLCESDLEVLYEQATTRLVSYRAVKDSAVALFVELGRDSSTSDSTVDFLVSKFDTKSSVQRHTLKNILVEIGDKAIDRIAAHVDYRGSEMEARALKQSLWVLGEIGGERIVDPAAGFIRDTEWSVRSGAFTALGKSGSSRALPYVREGLSDTVALVRKSAFHSLAQIATEGDVAYLIDGLDDPFYGVRYAALSGLRKSGCGWSYLIHAGIDDLNDFFYMSLKTECDTLHGFADLIRSMPPSVRKAAYSNFSQEEMRAALATELHPLLINYLIKRIAQIENVE
ncbi:MAG: HEAT repeat domain-containing protein [candidate division WOR-3 bacterium]|nr:MAG: HEAT repeat domain-containing protein [candidate division WOR-3 bacterium]